MDLAGAFLAAAREDLRAAAACRDRGRYPAAAFFSQQAGEKAAKAWLVKMGFRAGRTHYATPALVAALRRKGLQDSSLREAVDRLHDLEEYAAGARYPARGPAAGSYLPPAARIDREEAARAVATAVGVVAAFAQGLASGAEEAPRGHQGAGEAAGDGLDGRGPG